VKLAHRLILCAIVMLSSVSCDQVTKVAAASRLRGKPPVSLLGDTVRLVYAENAGGFLSLGASLPADARNWLFTSATALLVIGLVAFVVHHGSLSTGKVVALSLVAAGGVGNLIDRVSFGAVCDFLNVGIGPVRTGIFNIADVAITTGAALLFALASAARSR
jgi:signal peptidase II